MLVAICDDEKAECEKVSGILAQKMRKRREPLQIVCFQQGEDLIEQYEDGRKPGYDLIFMDIFLQKENGMEIVRRLRGYDRNVSVVFLTGSPDYAVESYEVWADGYLLKPVSQDKLENLLN
ncbi:response regulator, partial [Enterocloster asparagiformis]